MRTASTDYIKFAILLLAFILIFSVISAYNSLVIREESIKPDPALTELQEQFERLESDIDSLTESISEVKAWLDNMQVGEFTLSAYAPLDPNAKEGMCYSGDPYETKSGARTTPGVTIAVDPEVIPLGSKVYVQGYGWRVAHDVGSLIKGNRLDICVWTQKEAYAIGSGDRVMVIWQR